MQVRLWQGQILDPARPATVPRGTVTPRPKGDRRNRSSAMRNQVPDRAADKITGISPQIVGLSAPAMPIGSTHREDIFHGGQQAQLLPDSACPTRSAGPGHQREGSNDDVEAALASGSGRGHRHSGVKIERQQVIRVIGPLFDKTVVGCRSNGRRVEVHACLPKAIFSKQKGVVVSVKT
jgi:hypothetical protein